MIRKKKKKFTESMLWLVRLLTQSVEELFEGGLVNIYIKDLKRQHFEENVLFLVFEQKFINTLGKQKFLDIIGKTQVIEEYPRRDKWVVVTKGVGYDEVISLFLNGDFSKFPDWYKQRFPKVNPVKTEESIYHRVFNRDPEIRKVIEREIGQELDDEAEVRSSPKLRMETID